MSTVPVVQGAGSSNSAQDISTSSAPLTLKERISNLLSSTAFKTSEDIIDDGQINNSNKVFTDERLNAIDGVVESLSRRNSLVDQTQ